MLDLAPAEGSQVQRISAAEGSATVVEPEPAPATTDAHPEASADRAAPLLSHWTEPGAAPAGAARVVAATQADNVAFDGAFTTRLIKELQEHRQQSVASILDRLGEERLASPMSRIDGQHPTVAHVGPAAAPKEAGAGRKAAVYVANAHYKGKNIPTLPRALTESQQLKATLAARGYRTAGERQDVTAPAIEQALLAQVAQARPGDQQVFHYGGHGEREGLMGVDHAPMDEEKRTDLLPHAAVQGAVAQATEKGVDLTVILDACFSGGAADLVRREHRSALARQPAALCARPLLDVAEGCAKLRALLSRRGDPRKDPSLHVPPPAGTRAFVVLTGEQASLSDFWRETRAILHDYLAIIARFGGRLVPLPETGPTARDQIAQLIDRVAEAAVQAAEDLTRTKEPACVHLVD